jgi:hypothetical protein
MMEGVIVPVAQLPGELRNQSAVPKVTPLQIFASQVASNLHRKIAFIDANFSRQLFRIKDLHTSFSSTT